MKKVIALGLALAVLSATAYADSTSVSGAGSTLGSTKSEERRGAVGGAINVPRGNRNSGSGMGVTSERDRTDAGDRSINSADARGRLGSVDGSPAGGTSVGAARTATPSGHSPSTGGHATGASTQGRTGGDAE